MLISIGARRRPEALVDLLLECHQRIRAFVSMAGDIARRDDAPAHEVLEACAQCHRYFTEALPLHVADEEQSLLPKLVARGPGPDVEEALATMSAQHRQHQPLLSSLLNTLSLVQSAPDVGAHRRDLGVVARTLGLAFEEHLVLEEQRVFPAVQRLLSASEQEGIVAELRARRDPVGGSKVTPPRP